MLSLSKAANYNDNRYDVCPHTFFFCFFFVWCRFAVDSQVRLFWFDRSGALNFNIITLTDRLTHLSLFETRTCIPHCPTRYLTPIAINDFPTTVASDSECRSAYVRFSWYNVKLMIRFSLVASCVFPSGHHVILSVFVLTTCFFFEGPPTKLTSHCGTVFISSFFQARTTETVWDPSELSPP